MILDFWNELSTAIVSLAIGLGLIIGWIVDKPLGEAGFGMFGNAAIIFVGQIATLMGFLYFRYEPMEILAVSLPAAVFAGTVLLTLVAIMRARVR